MSSKLTKELAKTLSVTLPKDKGFHFHKAVGKYLNLFAVNLDDFAEKLDKVDIAALRFHMPRKDIENWIEKTIGDKELAKKIGAINDKKLNDNQLRQELVKIVKGRCDEIKEALKEEKPAPKPAAKPAPKTVAKPAPKPAPKEEEEDF